MQTLKEETMQLAQMTSMADVQKLHLSESDTGTVVLIVILVIILVFVLICCCCYCCACCLIAGAKAEEERKKKEEKEKKEKEDKEKMMMDGMMMMEWTAKVNFYLKSNKSILLFQVILDAPRHLRYWQKSKTNTTYNVKMCRINSSLRAVLFYLPIFKNMSGFYKFRQPENKILLNYIEN